MLKNIEKNDCFLEFMKNSLNSFEKSIPKEYEFLINEINNLIKNNQLIGQRKKYLLVDILDEIQKNKNKPFLSSNISITKISNTFIIESYLKNKIVCNYWSDNMTNILIDSLIETQFEIFIKSIDIITILINRSEKNFEFNSLEYLKKIKNNSNNERCGMIFAHYISNGLQPNLFGTSKVPFETNFFIGLILELERIKKLDLIINSNWFSNMMYLPRDFSYVRLLDSLDGKGFSNLWNITSIFQTINFNSDNPNYNLNQFFEKLDKSILNFDKFYEFLSEILICYRQTNHIPILINMLKKKPQLAIFHFERFAFFVNWKPVQTAYQIKKLSENINGNLEIFKNQIIDEFHSIVVKSL